MLIVTLPPSLSPRPYINTCSDFSLRVYSLFLQLYQERCVNGCVAGWVAGLVFDVIKSDVSITCVLFQMTSPSRRRTGWRASTLSVLSAGGLLR